VQKQLASDALRSTGFVKLRTHIEARRTSPRAELHDVQINSEPMVDDLQVVPTALSIYNTGGPNVEHDP
jgi:hypothetical protein